MLPLLQTLLAVSIIRNERPVQKTKSIMMKWSSKIVKIIEEIDGKSLNLVLETPLPEITE
jgi:uncharacterized protein YaaR (DUF327 family)